VLFETISSNRAGRFELAALGFGGGALEDGVEDDSGSRSWKRDAAGGHFVEYGAEAEKISAGVEFFAARLLGGHVGNSAHGDSGTGKGFLGGHSFH